MYVVPGYPVPMWNAWQWANGEHSLWTAGDHGNAPDVQRRDLDFVAEHPLWLRVREGHPLMRAARHLSWAVARTLGSLPGASRGEEQPPASGAGVSLWLRKVEHAVDGVRREAERLAEDVR